MSIDKKTIQRTDIKGVAIMDKKTGFHRGYKRGHDVGFAKGMLFGAIAVIGSAVVGVGIGAAINKFVK